MKHLLLLIALVITSNLSAQDSTTYWILKYSTPELAVKSFEEKRLDTLYAFSYKLNPFYICGDFDGDTKSDIAIFIKEKTSGKIGIAVIHGSTKEIFILGAGQIFNSIDDLKEFNIWTIKPKGTYTSHWEKKQISLKGEAFSIGVFECTGGLVYWENHKYNWYQLAD